MFPGIGHFFSKSMSSSTQDVSDPPHTGVSSSSSTDRAGEQIAGSILPSRRGERLIRASDPDGSTHLESAFRRRSDPEQAFKETCLWGLQARQPLARRVLSAKAACQEVTTCSVETLTEIWDAAKDLVAADSPVEARKAGFQLLAAYAEHSGFDAQERVKLFHTIAATGTATATDIITASDTITASFDPGDAAFRVKALNSLTDNGRNTSPFESQLAVTLNEWLGTIFDAALSARAQAKATTSLRVTGQSRTEEASIARHGKSAAQINEGLTLLLKLVTRIVRLSPYTFQEEQQLADVVKRVLWICSRTTDKGDIESGVNFMKVIREDSHIPDSCFDAYVGTLCAISCAVEQVGPEVGPETSDILFRLLTSDDGARTVDSLSRILLEAPPNKSSNKVRGALAMIKCLVMHNGRGSYPVIEFQALVDSLARVPSLASTRLDLDCLRTIGLLFDNEALVESVLGHDWEKLFSIIKQIATRPLFPRGSDAQSSIKERRKQLKEEKRPDSRLTDTLVHIAKALGSLWLRLDAPQRGVTAEFYWYMDNFLDAAAFDRFLSYMVHQRLCFPPHQDWPFNFRRLLEKYLFDNKKPSAVRCRALEMAKEIHKSMDKHGDRNRYNDMILSLLRKLDKERSLSVINSFASFSAACTADVDDHVFDKIVVFLQAKVAVQPPSAAATDSSTLGSDAINNTVECLVSLFLRCLESSAEKTKVVHKALVTIASSQELPTASRLTAMKLLTRLRCDSDDAVIVTAALDTQNLASALCRTEASIIPPGSEQTVLSRTSLVEESRVGRSSYVSRPNATTSRSGTRSASGPEAAARATPPLWLYPETRGLPEDPPNRPSPIVRIYTNGPREEPTLELSIWLETVIGILQQGRDWEIQSYILVHLPSQLSNPSLFAGALPSIKMLRNVVCEQLMNGSFIEPPSATGLKRSDVALCLFHTLIMLLGYHDHFAKSEEDDIVKTFLTGIDFRDRTAKCCIHALSVCCHELPRSIARSLDSILHKMSQIITQTHLAMDTLEFLDGLARLPHVYVNLAEDELRLVFGICIRYLHHSREQRQNSSITTGVRTGHNSVRLSATSGEIAAASDNDRNADAHRDLPQYVFALAYHVITIWFLSLRLQDRSKHVGWITKSLAAKDDLGNHIMEEQSQVTLDMMHRTAYSDLGETKSNPMFTSADGDVIKRSWLVGMSIVTVETAVSTGMSQITKRQASGTTHAMYQQQTAPLPPHHVPAPTDHHSANVVPNHVFLQLTSTIAPTPIPMQPIPLPEDDATKRAISAFDRNDTVDGHKVGFIYIGNNQTSEAEILANTMGSEAYYTCLRGLGTEVRLKDAVFNTQGLDRVSDADGQHTYAWRDRITEIIFHVTTLMPTDIQLDAQCVNKKRHIGNDFVNIIYNDSGLPFRFETFPSQFNYVNIIITPEASLLPGKFSEEATQSPDATGPETAYAKFPAKQEYFKVQTICAPSFPHISPAATPKLISASALPGFLRQLALNASVFSLVWANRAGGDHVSSWRNRLHEIVRLRERFTAGRAAGGTARTELYPEMGGAAGRARARAQAHVEGEAWRGTVAMGGVVDEEGLVGGIDFSRWAS